MLRFLSVSDRYSTGAPQGHSFSFQQSLAAAIERAGDTFAIAAPATRVTADDPLVGLRLTSRAWPVIATEVAAHLQDAPRHAVLVYEGGLEALAAFVPVARQCPDHVFLLNLFRSEAPLDVPRSEPRGLRGLALPTPVPLDLPPNLVVLADTDRRAFLARSVGIPVQATWPTHSMLAAPPVIEFDQPVDSRRILIALSPWQLKGDSGTVQDVTEVLGAARRRLPDLRFELLGGVADGHGSRRVRAMLRRLPGAQDGPLSRDGYAQRLGSSGIVWLPKLDLYASQSSGKVLDALVMGRPVLVPSGTYGQTEQERWVHGAPSYRSLQELWDLLEHLDRFAALWADELRTHRADIRARYSPDRAAKVLTRLSELAGVER
jgi:hypothetical protein